ncbi:MFS transporter [Mycolicibacterium elephantis]|nr:MFS transporter [Mycolicibacterium elephantis]
MAAVSIALFCVQIDYFAMNLALPRMAAEFGSTATDLQWIISVYMLTLGAFMVPAGRIGDIYGRRRALLAGVALFGLASAACALAPTVTVLIVFRAIQGLGAALIFPVSISVLTNAFPAAKAGHAIGLAYGIAALGNAGGPLIGGLLTDTVGWRWIFWLNLPLVLACLVIGAWSIAESHDHTVPRRLDVTGLALITAAIGLFTLTFDRVPSWGWLSGSTLLFFAGALAAMAGFVVAENRIRWPLVDLSLARNPKFVILVVAGTISNIAYAVTIFLSTLYLQQARGLDPLTAGLVFLGPSAGAALGGVLSGRLAATRPPVAVMGATTVIAALCLATLAVSDGWLLYLPALTACGFTLGLVYAFTTVATQAAVRPERAGEAAGVTLTAMVTIGGVGVAVSATVLEMLQRSGMTTAGAVDVILVVLAVLLLPAGATVLLSARRTATESASSRPAA